MPYNGIKARRDRERLAQAILAAQQKPLEYRGPLGVDARISSPFGERVHPITHQSQFHTGVDIAVPEGSPVYATEDGYISQAQNQSSGSIMGNNVFVQHPDGRQTRYEHLSRFGDRALKGGAVKKGDLIGFSGTTGRSTGPHLHYGRYNKGKAEDPFA